MDGSVQRSVHWCSHVATFVKDTVTEYEPLEKDYSENRQGRADEYAANLRIKQLVWIR